MFLFLCLTAIHVRKVVPSTDMYGECKAFDAAAFIGKWGEIYSVARSIVNAKIKQCKYRSEKSDLINIATSNQISLVDKDHIIYFDVTKFSVEIEE